MKKLVALPIIFAAVLVCYAPATGDGFVWDDTALILRDPLLRSWRLIPEGFNHFLFVDATASNFYRPLQRLTYTLDYAAFAFRPGPYHLVSVLWHAAAAVAFLFFAEELLIVFGFALRTRRLIAMLVALVWAVHPVQSAAVAYVSGRADPLAAVFGFTGLYLTLRGARVAGRGRFFFLAGGGVALLLSALSKETGLVFPAIAMLFFALRNNWTAVWKTLAVAAFVCAIYFSLRAGAEKFPPPELSPPPPLLVRPIIVARAMAEYTGLILFPTNLHMDRDVETHPAGFSDASLTAAAWRELQTLIGMLLIAALFWWLLRAHRRNRAAFTALLFALITYLPVSGIATLNASVAEHWVYLPSAFFFLAASIEAASILPGRWQSSIIRFAATSLFMLWLVFLGGRTFVRTFDWKNERTFFERTIARGGDSARMLINLAGVELAEGKLEAATVHLHSALQKKPDQPMAVLNLGAIALKQNNFKLARELLTRATKMPLVDARAHELLTVLENKESRQVDLVRLRLAARTGIPNWEIERRYINVLDESRSTGAAINELLTCLQTQWYRAESWRLLSELEQKAGHPDQAANALAQARAYDVHLGAHPPG